MDAFDVAVIGGGPAGAAASRQAARYGANVCLIEQDHIGGTCLNTGCIPSKALLASSHAMWSASTAANLGIRIQQPFADETAVMRRISDLVKKLRYKMSESLSSNEGIKIIRGRARFHDSNFLEIESGDQHIQIRAENSIVATGSRPVTPEKLPWQSGRILTSDEIFSIPQLPRSIIVMGGGILGCELAIAFAELGVKTFVVEGLDRLIATIPIENASDIVKESLEARGAQVFLDTLVEDTIVHDDSVDVRLSNGTILNAQYILVTVGRKANIEDLGLENAAVKIENDIIKVDEHCRTNVDNIYAAGDVAENNRYVHLAEQMGRIAADNAMGYGMTDDRTMVPICVYTHPQIAMVGLTEKEVFENYENIGSWQYNYDESDSAIIGSSEIGFLRVFADKDTGKIYGAYWIAPNAAELINELVVAIKNNVTMKQIFYTIHSQPGPQSIVQLIAQMWSTDNMRHQKVFAQKRIHFSW